MTAAIVAQFTALPADAFKLDAPQAPAVAQVAIGVPDKVGYAIPLHAAGIPEPTPPAFVRVPVGTLPDRGMSAFGPVVVTAAASTGISSYGPVVIHAEPTQPAFERVPVGTTPPMMLPEPTRPEFVRVPLGNDVGTPLVFPVAGFRSGAYVAASDLAANAAAPDALCQHSESFPSAAAVEYVRQSAGLCFLPPGEDDDLTEKLAKMAQHLQEADIIAAYAAAAVRARRVHNG